MLNRPKDVVFEVLTAVTVFWIVMLYSLVEGY
jgi:hypothetical protein